MCYTYYTTAEDTAVEINKQRKGKKTMKRIITNENFWTMDEKELDACIKAFRHNGWWWYSTSSRFDCQREYDSFMCAYGDYIDTCEDEEDVEPMSVEDLYWEFVASGM